MLDEEEDQHDPKVSLIYTLKNSPNAFGQLFVSMCDFKNKNKINK